MADLKKSKNQLLFRWDAQHKLLIALGVAIVVLFIVISNKSTSATILSTWIAFALTIIIMDWLTIGFSHPREVRKIARLQDSSRSLIFLFVMAASVASLFAVFFLLKSGKGHGGKEAGNILLVMSAVMISWWLVHTVFTMRYAHMYYDTTTDDGGQRKGGGLEFPGDEKEPDYLDFVYFSFVLGMTFQVSDVEISDRRIRRLAWFHGLISFAYNTTIVALTINIISGLVQ